MDIEKKLLTVNFTKGRGGITPIAIVLHLMDGTLQGTDAWFHNPESQVSSHYGMGKDGKVIQWVNEEDTAYTNGRVYQPTWKLYRSDINPNRQTITIEHEGDTDPNTSMNHVWTEAMYRADAELIRQIAARWHIPLDRDHIIGHNEIYAKKPNCPGSGLNWQKLMSMLGEPLYRNQQVKGDKQPEIYYVDFGGVKHHIPSWDFYTEFFKGEPTILPQEDVDGMVEGKPFSL